MSLDPGVLATLQEWRGKSEHAQDMLDAWPANALAATLDRDMPALNPGDPLPPLWHWIYGLPIVRQSELGPDGHAARGGFLPPVPLPRRMWAGGRLKFVRPLRIGGALRRDSTIDDVASKEGRSGVLVFVRVRHEFSDADGVALTEEHDIVYRDHAVGPASTPPQGSANATWIRDIHPDPVLLFRYSALTFNGHRIHYDHPYVTQVEGYPGLIVHGPLIATLLCDLLARNLPHARLETFSFRAVSPLFATAPFAVCGRQEGSSVQLWARNAQGGLAMEATAGIA